jgi:Raf kinase inhibitor-like YbhB/YbcL family protein
MAFSLSSEAFSAGETIPSRYTCDGEDTSPVLSWGDVPSNTEAFALIVDDPDAPGGVFTHWVLFNLPASAQGLPGGVPKTERLESGALQGRNGFGRIGYGGPCPPPGKPHRYRFSLYALDAPLDLEPGVTKQQVLNRMQGHILGETQLVGTYQR